MKNETKIEKLKKWIAENHLWCRRGRRAGQVGHSDLFLPKYRIYIKISTTPEEDAIFWERHHICCSPIFIRDNETPKFCLEKLQNTIIKVMQIKNKKYLKRKEQESKANESNTEIRERQKRDDNSQRATKKANIH